MKWPRFEKSRKCLGKLRSFRKNVFRVSSENFLQSVKVLEALSFEGGSFGSSNTAITVLEQKIPPLRHLFACSSKLVSLTNREPIVEKLTKTPSGFRANGLDSRDQFHGVWVNSSGVLDHTANVFS